VALRILDGVTALHALGFGVGLDCLSRIWFSTLPSICRPSLRSSAGNLGRCERGSPSDPLDCMMTGVPARLGAGGSRPGLLGKRAANRSERQRWRAAWLVKHASLGVYQVRMARTWVDTQKEIGIG